MRKTLLCAAAIVAGIMLAAPQASAAGFGQNRPNHGVTSGARAPVYHGLKLAHHFSGSRYGYYPRRGYYDRRFQRRFRRNGFRHYQSRFRPNRGRSEFGHGRSRRDFGQGRSRRDFGRSQSRSDSGRGRNQGSRGGNRRSH